VVVGDVNSTLACSLVAAKRGIKVLHVEAGLRSFDRSMPEEINRVLTDQVADLLYTTERSAQQNLRREGIDDARVVFVGNLMIDSLRTALPNAVAPVETLRRAGVSAPWMSELERFGVVTLHRPSNVDDPETLQDVLITLSQAAERVPLIWPMHPRTRGNIDRLGLDTVIGHARIAALPPQGYLEMVGLMNAATFVLTDSGGIQEETTALGVPCLTMRENTERPITIEQGTNVLVGRDRQRVLAAIDEIIASGGKRGRVPELWDGRTAGRIAAHLAQWLATETPSEVAR
jgi:UDP-N-acetylglucosamine 2-epimerase (non-hydrolysing)